MDFFATARRQMLAGQLADARERLLASYEGLTPEQMQQPGVAGDWSVRDNLAHIVAWDRETTRTFRAMLAGDRPHFLDFSEEDIETFNHERHAAMLNRSLDEVLSELVAAREEMLEVLREVSNEQLFAPAPGDEHADLSIAACIGVTADHDEEHAELIENWRDEHQGQ